jgi:hypothetical protein
MPAKMTATWWVVLPVVLCAIIFIVLFLYLLVRNMQRPPAYDLNLSEVDRNTIFVSIASYRDELCPRTLRSLYGNAAHPENVYVGLCLQNAKGDPACPDGPLCVSDGRCFDDHIRVHKMSHLQAKGPAYARYHCAQLSRGERYFMQIDSHMEFVKDWDAKILQQCRDCPLREGSAGPVLTHYPPANMTDSIRAGKETVHICKGKFESEGMVSFLSNQFGAIPRPKTSRYIAGGFLFGPGSILTRVPYDPHVDHLFWGEELVMAARLWTSGYDIFYPAAAICSHAYERFDKPNVFSDHSRAGLKWRQQQHKVHSRVRQLLGWEARNTKMHKELDKYGMGTDRTLAEFFADSGIDFKTKQVGDHC